MSDKKVVEETVEVIEEPVENISPQKTSLPEDVLEKVTEIEDTFISILEFLNNKREFDILQNNLLAPLTRTLSTNRKLFRTKGGRDFRKKLLIDAMSVSISDSRNSNFMESIMSMYASGPFGAFNVILDIPASDIFIVGDKISFSRSNTENSYNIVIPEHLIGIYNRLISIFIDITIAASSEDYSTKFDKGNAIKDYSLNEIRFNVVHGSLNVASNSPIIALRKQTINSNYIALSEDYVNSLGLTETQKEFIHDVSFNGSFCIFGETGSGKSTLLNYMASYRLSDKRNMIMIQDTPEIFLPINISYITNSSNDIADLFKLALRENPSHVCIGEIRSYEVADVLTSSLVFNTAVTLHADSFEKVIMRIVFMIHSSPEVEYSNEDINMLISAAEDCFIHMRDRKVVGIWKKKKNLTPEMMKNAMGCYEPVL